MIHIYAGSEAMFADLGHFSQLSIKVINFFLFFKKIWKSSSLISYFDLTMKPVRL